MKLKLVLVVLALALAMVGCGETSGEQGGSGSGLSRRAAERQAATEVLEEHGWNHHNAVEGTREVEEALGGR
jgi:hypothetical protein